MQKYRYRPFLGIGIGIGLKEPILFSKISKNKQNNGDNADFYHLIFRCREAKICLFNEK